MTQTVTGTPSDGAVIGSDAEFERELWAWVAELTGGLVTSHERIVAGTRESWSVEVSTGDDDLALIARRGRATLRIYGDYLREVRIYQALAETPVPVPRMLGVRPDLRLVVAERVPGTSDLLSLPPAERESASDALMVAIAALHRLDPAALDLPQMPLPQNGRENATLDLDHWQRFHAAHCPPDPVVSFTLAWLRGHAHVDVPRTVLVQGDTGPGNFLAHEGCVSAVVDWELSHLGDPYEDLGWVVTRSLLFPFGDLGHRLRVYADAGGVPFDRDRTWHGAITGMVKCLIAEDAVRTGGDADAEYPVVVSGPIFHGRLAIEAILRQAGVASRRIEAPSPMGADGETATAFAYARTTLRERLLPTLGDRVHIELTRSVLRTVRHLALTTRLDPVLDRIQQAELSELLGHDDDVLALRRMLCEQIDGGALGESLDPLATLRYLDRQVQRDTIRGAELLGPMARTQLPEIA